MVPAGNPDGVEVGWLDGEEVGEGIGTTSTTTGESTEHISGWSRQRAIEERERLTLRKRGDTAESYAQHTMRNPLLSPTPTLPPESGQSATSQVQEPGGDYVTLG